MGERPTPEATARLPTLEDAIALALKAHRGQADKGDEPYILHPLRLMLKMDNEEARMAAVLHDVVEDGGIKLDELVRSGYPRKVIRAVDALSRRKAEGESYEAFIERLKPNALARRVKLADLEDNMDIRRIPQPTTEDLERLQRYRRAWAVLRAEDVANLG